MHRGRKRGALSARLRHGRGLTLIELLLVLALLGILMSWGVSAFFEYRDRIAVQKAITDIAAMSLQIQEFRTDFHRFPTTLAQAGITGKFDPWGNSYVYTDLSGPGGRGASRKDRRLNPLNSDFDLFSTGKNGTFKPQISHRESLDDVIRARDGRFIDLAEKF
jgi:general secretion pathway protein G